MDFYKNYSILRSVKLKLKPLALSAFWLNVGKLAAGSMVAQLSGILLSPVILRIFDSKDIGMLNLFNQAVAFFMVFSVLRLDRAIVLAKNDEAKKILQSGLLLIVITTLLITLATFPFSGFWFGFMKLDYPALFILALPVSFLLQSTINFYKAAGNVFTLYSVLGTVIAIQAILTQILKITFGFSLGKGPAWLILAEMAGYCTTLIFLLIVFHKKAKFGFRIASFQQLKEILASKAVFLKYDIPAAMLNYFSSSIAVFLLAMFYDTRVVGYYALGYSMLRLPMTLMGKAIGDVFYKNAADIGDKMELLRKSASNVVIQLFSFGLLPMASIFFFGDVIFSFAFGKHWIIAGQYAQIISTWTLVWFISSPISNLYYILKIQHRFTAVMFSSLVLRAGAIVVGSLIGDIWLTLILFSIISLLVYGYQVVFLLHRLHVRAGDFLKALWKSTRFAVVPLLIMTILNLVSLPTPITLAIIVPVITLAMAFRWKYKPQLKL